MNHFLIRWRGWDGSEFGLISTNVGKSLGEATTYSQPRCSQALQICFGLKEKESTEASIQVTRDCWMVRWGSRADKLGRISDLARIIISTAIWYEVSCDHLYLLWWSWWFDYHFAHYRLILGYLSNLCWKDNHHTALNENNGVLSWCC